MNAASKQCVKINDPGHCRCLPISDFIHVKFGGQALHADLADDAAFQVLHPLALVLHLDDAGRDDRAGQTIELHTAASGQVFELKIISAYPGKKYKDLAISELVLYDGDKPFVLQTPLPEQYRQQVAAKAAATPLDAILNRRISNHIEEPMMISDQSIILRSDGTFVLYNYWVDETDTEYETIADGNWELLEAGPKQARVKVFGKWHDLSNFVAWYQGNKQVQTTRIFNDILTIDARQLRGEKK